MTHEQLEERAFLNAIIARPLDDLPRLLFADYLDENREWERAEFIRVQCELARIPTDRYGCQNCSSKAVLHNPFSAEECCCRFKERIAQLRARERELLNLDRCVIWGDLPVGDEIFYSPKRGFVEEIACSWSDWQRHADAIRAATPLRKVRLTTEPNDGVLMFGMAQVGAIPQVTKIHGYPGIEFELPTVRDEPFDDFASVGRNLDELVSETAHLLGFTDASITVVPNFHRSAVTIYLDKDGARSAVELSSVMILSARSARRFVELVRDAVSRADAELRRVLEGSPCAV